MKNQLLNAVIAVMLLLPASGSAGIKCWTNSEGVRECGNVVPPEYAQQGHEEIGKSGVVTERVERAKTPEELAAEAEQKRKEEEIARQKAEQEKLDRILLDTYSVADEITMARDGKINIINNEIKIAEGNIQNAKQSLQQYQKSAANMERNGKPLPDNLKSDITKVKQQIKNYESFIKNKEQEKQVVYKDYESRLDRFLVLTGKKKPQAEPGNADSNNSAGSGGKNTATQ
jgi:hypothetical protein